MALTGEGLLMEALQLCGARFPRRSGYSGTRLSWHRRQRSARSRRPEGSRPHARDLRRSLPSWLLHGAAAVRGLLIPYVVRVGLAHAKADRRSSPIQHGNSRSVSRWWPSGFATQTEVRQCACSSALPHSRPSGLSRSWSPTHARRPMRADRGFRVCPVVRAERMRSHLVVLRRGTVLPAHPSQ